MKFKCKICGAELESLKIAPVSCPECGFLQFSSEAAEAEFFGFCDDPASRPENAAGLYLDAKGAMARAKTEDELLFAAAAFSLAIGHEDAFAKMEECMERAKKLREKRIDAAREVKSRRDAEARFKRALESGAFDSKDEIIIPGTIGRIPDGAFESNKTIRRVTVAEGITSIGKNAFRNSSLTKISLPKSLVSIGDNAFSDCDLLLSVEIPSGVKVLAESAFFSCDNLAEIVNNSESINSELSPALTSWSIKYAKTKVHSGNSAIVKVGDYLFFNHLGVRRLLKYLGSEEEITLPEFMGQTNYEIANNAFARTPVRCVVIPSGVTEIGRFAFAHCKNLRKIIIPESVSKIGICAFYTCHGIKILCRAKKAPAGWDKDWNLTDGPLFSVKLGAKWGYKGD